jgi:hypothetical protein
MRRWRVIPIREPSRILLGKRPLIYVKFRSSHPVLASVPQPELPGRKAAARNSAFGMLPLIFDAIQSSGMDHELPDRF